MASSQEQLKHRTTTTKDEATPDIQHTTTTSDEDMNRARKKTSGSVARGARSLSIAVGFPVFLTVLDVYFFGSSSRYRTLHKPFYVPPLWALHTACVLSSFFVGLSAWLVWAEGGFHRRPNALTMYIAQLLLSLSWYVTVFGAGLVRVGMALCGALLVASVGCERMFRGMNPIAGDLVRLSMVWPVMLAVVNVRFLYH